MLQVGSRAMSWDPCSTCNKRDDDDVQPCVQGLRGTVYGASDRLNFRYLEPSELLNVRQTHQRRRKWRKAGIESGGVKILKAAKVRVQECRKGKGRPGSVSSPSLGRKSQ